MNEQKEIRIGVNELNRIIAEKYGYQYCSSIDMEYAPFLDQHNPKKYKLGPGSSFSIRFNLR